MHNQNTSLTGHNYRVKQAPFQKVRENLTSHRSRYFHLIPILFIHASTVPIFFPSILSSDIFNHHFISIINFIHGNAYSNPYDTKSTNKNFMDWHEFYHSVLSLLGKCMHIRTFKVYTVEIYHLVMGNKWLINIYSDHYVLRPLMHLFTAKLFLLEYILPILKDRNSFQQLKGAVSCKELLHSVRGGGKSLILDFRSEPQWLTWFWRKLWAWMTSLKKDHGIREKAICFKTVIWSRFFSACSAPVPGQDSFLSLRMLLFLVSF